MPGPFGGQAGGRDGTGRGSAPGSKGSGGDKGGGFNYMDTPRFGNYRAGLFNGPPQALPKPAGLMAAAPTPAPTQPIQQPPVLQGLMSQSPMSSLSLGNRFGPTHPLVQYLLGQTPQAQQANPLDPAAALKKRFGNPVMA